MLHILEHDTRMAAAQHPCERTPRLAAVCCDRAHTALLRRASYYHGMRRAHCCACVHNAVLRRRLASAPALIE